MQKLLSWTLILLQMAVTSLAIRAVCDLNKRSGNGQVSGFIKLEGDSFGTHISGKIHGLAPGKHGFHVHEFGDTSNNCKAAGGHFNPLNRNHGAATANERHVGDLGNINSGSSGTSFVRKSDRKALLHGPHSIIGRAIVLHEGEDDSGLGNNQGSLKTGNAGARAACCIIREIFPLFSFENFMSIMSRLG